MNIENTSQLKFPKSVGFLKTKGVYQVVFDETVEVWFEKEKVFVSNSKHAVSAVIAVLAYKARWNQVASQEDVDFVDQFDAWQDGIGLETLIETTNFKLNKLEIQTKTPTISKAKLPRAVQRDKERSMEIINAKLRRKNVLAPVYNLVGRTTGPRLEDIAARETSAKALGGVQLIPEITIAFDEYGRSSGEYECGYQEQMFFALIRNRLAVGQRAFAFRGPPGSGKDTFAQQIAAIRHAPFVAFNIGPNYSFEDAIGTDGLKPQTVVTPDRTVKQPDQRITNADGTVNILQGGDMLVPGAQTTVPVSAQIEGPLARAVKEDAVVVIQEPEGMENEAVRLHSVAGDRVGDPNHRYLTVNSAGGDLFIPVHPECILIFTYNSGKEDVRFKTALHDRMGNLDFEYPDQEAEARRYARMVSTMMKQQTLAPELARDYLPEELLPMVRVMERARNAHAQDPEDFKDMPGSRQAVHCYCDLLLLGYAGDVDPVETMSSMLCYLLPGSDLMTIEERKLKIREVLTSDERDALMDLSQRAAGAKLEE